MTDWAKTLEDELNWREAEIASLKAAVLEAPKGSVRERSLLRALWAMMYAHYEGFCKFTWDFYLENIEKLGVSREACCSAVVKFSLAKQFRELRGNMTADSLWAVFTNGFGEWMKEQLNFELKLETNSNLWPSLLKENSSLVDLPFEMVNLNEHRLKALVSRRNEIAHGKKMVIQTIEEYQPYEEAALLVMHELAVAVLECLEQKRYLKSRPPAQAASEHIS